ncbi:MAG: AbrB/MazE/SpoVT family DNA-binding domain-containing protein [Desulfobacterales bacterium]|nr:AbrB/MazE/SpoVT family DNA-binding domain-containing protein [Desulfobacterales bacterium]
MISTAKISKKGQIVMPKEIRKVIGLGPGDRVIFTLTKKGHW